MPRGLLGIPRILLIVGAALCVTVGTVVSPAAPVAARSNPTPTPNAPIVINLQVIPASRAAAILRSIYPSANITVDSHANAVIVVAPGYQEEGMRTIASGIDVKNPTDTVVDTVQLRVISPDVAAQRLAAVYPSARILAAPNRNVIIMASPADMAQIKAIIQAIDTAPPTPSPKPRYPVEAVRVTQRNAKTLARIVAAQSPGVRVEVSSSEILLSGPPDDVDRAKQLISELDVPQSGTQYTQVYRLKYVDAQSVADLFTRSFPNLPLQVNSDLNAITVTSNLTVQRRIADAISQLDVAPPGANGSAGGEAGGGGGSSGVDVVELHAAVPGPQGGQSTTATDIANTVTQALQNSASDLHIVVPPNSTELVLTGSPYSIKLAKELIEKLDQPQTMVALDTEVLEVDEGVVKQLGVQFPNAALSTTFQEVPPLYPPGNTVPGAGQQIPYLSLFPLIRTPMQLEAVLNFLIQTNHARILEDPRITTISGRTASLRAGETVNILTTTGGGTGTVATTQVQSFQTGVTLDITPVVNADNYITVTLHPSVNSIAAINASTGVPNIQSRDTTTTVGLQDGETIVVGGLIEEDDERTTQKVPILGDIPLIGPILFQYHNVQHTRNELIVTVTPHILRPGDSGAIGENRLGIPRPEGLPTLPPGTELPPPRRLPEAEATPSQEQPAPAPEPQPVTVPTPRALPAHVSPTPPPGGIASTASPHAAGMPQPSNAPAPLPTAFSQTNTYTFGAAPQNNYAAANAAPQIFYVQVTPSVVHNGDQMTISAITSTNVAKLSFGPNAIVPMANLQSVGPGQWQATFNFSSAGLPIGQTSVSLTLTATTGLGSTVSLPIPMSVLGP
ncbi:MAG TPA: secretin N-terminal domain-containing protein [Candidatus Acidoferrales bacterium]|nr:secretin N-terminal domain-containing protein [Candidatus Acidoferrales bacterium]